MLQEIHLGCVFLLDMSLSNYYSFQTCSRTGSFLPIMLPGMFAIPIIAINPVLRVKLQMCRIDYPGNFKELKSREIKCIFKG